MVRVIAHCRKLLVVSAIALAFPVYGIEPSAATQAAQATSLDAPIAEIYKGTKRVAEVIKIGRILGSGAAGKVQKVRIRNSRGKEQDIALKIFNPDMDAEDLREIEKSWTALAPVFEDDYDGVLNYGTAGLKLVYAHPKAQTSSVIITALAIGDATTQKVPLLLIPKHPQFEARLATLSKLYEQMLSAVSNLSSHGFAHGDIKPENILYDFEDDEHKKNYNWAKLDPNDIHFFLTDFDDSKRIGRLIPGLTKRFAPPETLMMGDIRATPAWDLYSLSTSTYSLIFGKTPLEDYFHSVHKGDLLSANLKKESQQIYSNPKNYAKVMNHVNERFIALEEQASPSTQKLLQRLHRSVMNGLLFSPQDRLNAFPNIKEGAQRFLKLMVPVDTRCFMSHLNGELNDELP